MTRTAGLLPLVLISLVKAGTSACSGSYSIDTNPTTGIVGTAGCEQGDKIFNAFVYQPNSGTAPTGSDIFVSFSGTNPAGPITDTFTSTGWTLSTVGMGSEFLYNSTQVDQVMNPGYLLSGFDLNPGAVTLPSTCAGTFCDAVDILTTFCTNDNTTCSPGDPNYGQFQWVDGAVNGVTIQSFCYGNGSAANACTNGAYEGATSISFDPSLGITSIFVTNEVIIANYDGLTAGITGFSNDFFEEAGSASPEPGTFLLLAAGLAAVGWTRRGTIRQCGRPVSSLPRQQP
jgi:hypothetical protein